MKTKMIYVEGEDVLVYAYATQYGLEHNPDEYMICRIPAGDGYRANIRDLALACEYCRKDTIVVVTNAVHLLGLIALDGASRDLDELWFAHENEFINVFDIYPNIRPVNNLMKMYMSGLIRIEGEENE